MTLTPKQIPGALKGLREARAAALEGGTYASAFDTGWNGATDLALPIIEAQQALLREALNMLIAVKKCCDCERDKNAALIAKLTAALTSKQEQADAQQIITDV